jgi:hypothetical protein
MIDSIFRTSPLGYNRIPACARPVAARDTFDSSSMLGYFANPLVEVEIGINPYDMEAMFETFATGFGSTDSVRYADDMQCYRVIQYSP